MRRSTSPGRKQSRRKAGDPEGSSRPRDPRGESMGSARLTAAQKAIGGFLRSAREAQRLTQKQVAELTASSPWRLSRAAISAIERGQNFPGMEAMLALSNVLYVDPKELIERARTSTTIPIDVTGLTYEELNRRATDLFWKGEFREALSVYDAMLERLALENTADDSAGMKRLAALEVRRATAFKRAGALLTAIATAERAVSLGEGVPEVQADAYVVLADLQCQRGHLPLAADAAQRALDLCEDAAPQTRGWAWMVKARVEFLAGRHGSARKAFLAARQQARRCGDERHLTHIEGDIGVCWLHEGRPGEARKWLRRAVDLARRHSQPALEASWLVELGKLALQQDRIDEARDHARAALEIAGPLEHVLTIFRAEWLDHQIARRLRESDPDRERLAYLRQLLVQLDQHEGIEEIREFKQLVIGAREGGDRRRK